MLALMDRCRSLHHHELQNPWMARAGGFWIDVRSVLDGMGMAGATSKAFGDGSVGEEFGNGHGKETRR